MFENVNGQGRGTPSECFVHHRLALQTNNIHITATKKDSHELDMQIHYVQVEKVWVQLSNP